MSQLGMTADGNPRDVALALGFAPWEDTYANVTARNLGAFLCSSTACRRLLVANPFRSALTYAVRGGPGAPREDGLGEKATLLQPLRLRRRNPVGIRQLRQAYESYDRKLARALARERMTRPAVVTTDPFVAGYSPLEWAGPVTYYARDDWSSHPRYRSYWPAFTDAYAKIADRRRGVCAVSSGIIDRISPTGPVAVVPNGVNAAEWRLVRNPPTWTRGLSRPWIVYAGSLEGRVDVDLVAATAQAFPAASLLLMGPVHEPELFRELADLQNVRITGKLSRTDVAGVLSAADVGLIPHRRTSLTNTMSPFKLYEYLSAGLPVATVDLPGVAEVDRRVIVGDGIPGFPAAVSEALQRGRMRNSDRLRFIEEHSWTARFERVLPLLLLDGTQ